jgi:hypothetical protein
VIGVNEGRSLDAIAALPSDREGGIGLFDVDRFALAVSRQPCRVSIGGVEQPGIAGFGREKDQLTNADAAAVVVRRPALNIPHLAGQAETATLDPRLMGLRPGACLAVLSWNCDCRRYVRAG